MNLIRDILDSFMHILRWYGSGERRLFLRPELVDLIQDDGYGNTLIYMNGGKRLRIKGSPALVSAYLNDPSPISFEEYELAHAAGAPHPPEEPRNGTGQLRPDPQL